MVCLTWCIHNDLFNMIFSEGFHTICLTSLVSQLVRFNLSYFVVVYFHLLRLQTTIHDFLMENITIQYMMGWEPQQNNSKVEDQARVQVFSGLWLSPFFSVLPSQLIQLFSLLLFSCSRFSTEIQSQPGLFVERVYPEELI